MATAGRVADSGFPHENSPEISNQYKNLCWNAAPRNYHIVKVLSVAAGVCFSKKKYLC